MHLMFSKKGGVGRSVLCVMFIAVAGGCLNLGSGKSGTWIRPPAKVVPLPPANAEVKPPVVSQAPSPAPVKPAVVASVPAAPNKPPPAVAAPSVAVAPAVPMPPAAIPATVSPAKPPPVSPPEVVQATNVTTTVKTEPPVPDFRTTVAVQTLLDRANFSPNCIDGKWGDYTRTALATWQADRRLPASGEFDDATRAALGGLERAFTTHTVTPEEHSALTPVPATWRGKSQVTSLGYLTILEMLAERYHAAETTIEKLNPTATWPNPPAGTVVAVPAGGGRIAKPVNRIEVDLNAKLVRGYAVDGRLVALFPCSIGGDASKRPVGDLKVIRCAKDPVFIFDPEVFMESEEARTINSKLLIPPGPNNPVGVAWIGLNLPGYGIHGTPHPEDIGKTESHGCFRLANWNASKLLAAGATGIPVTIK